MTFSRILATAVLVAGAVAQKKSSTDGVALTSLYWDCCKQSCSWADHGDFVGNPTYSCDINGTRHTDFNLGTGCSDGEAYSCQDQIPWAVNDTFSYGFVGAYLAGYLERTWCCGCYEIEFTDSSIKGKKMIVQASNTNYDSVHDSMFVFGIPGGYDYSGACRKQFGASEINGKENDGVLRREQCELLPDSLRPGCEWRFDWFEDAKKPNITWKRVACPSELTKLSGCMRNDEDDFITQGVTNDTIAPPADAASKPVGTLSVLSGLAVAAVLGLAATW